MSEIPKAYEPQSVEDKWYDFWLKQGCFTADPARVSEKRPAYAIVIPPPNVTGMLHMGHVLNNTIQDILSRKARMDGKEVLWLPGTDHAGIATQVMVEKQLKKEEKKSRHDLGREEFLKRVWAWKEKHGGIIINQLKKLGCSCDWTRERFTMDAEYSRCVQKVFVELYRKGLIYRGKRMVNWCPVSQTALSDEEVEMKPQKGFMYYFKVQVVDATPSSHDKVVATSAALVAEKRDGGVATTSGDGGVAATWLTIATTRPETIPADTAVAVNPKDPRYAHLIGKHVYRALPLDQPKEQRIIPIIGDEQVDFEFGTGVLKVTPAHDKTDFEIGQRHQLPLIDIITPDGKMAAGAGADLVGLDRFVARKKSVELLEAAGTLVKTEPYENNVGFSQRAGVPIEPRLSEQWFLKYPAVEQSKACVEQVATGSTPAPGVADRALAGSIGGVKESGSVATSARARAADGASAAAREARALPGKMRFHPQRWAKVYDHWLTNIQDWCISRQLWWGHRIPVWYNRPGLAILNQKSVVVVEVDQTPIPHSTVRVAREAAWQHLEEQGWLNQSFRNLDTGYDFIVTRAGLKHAFSHPGVENVVAATVLPDLIRTAIFVGETWHEPRIPEIKRVLQLFAAMRFEGALVAVKITVKEYQDGSRVYDHETEKIRASDGQSLGRRSADGVLRDQPTSDAGVPLRQLIRDVNREGAFTRVQESQPGDGWEQDPDVLDTWFSSWLWPFATMGWPEQTETLKKFYPTTDLVTGPDIIFFWVARMIMAGYEFMGDLPFRNVYFTGIIRDKQGRKMSKTLGNSPDPLELIAKYGADALRFGTMRSAPLGQDVLFDEKDVELGRNFCNKLWNACRFRQMVGGQGGGDASSPQGRERDGGVAATSGDGGIAATRTTTYEVQGEINPALLTNDDKWILLKLSQAIQEITTALHTYNFSTAVQTLYRFFWNEYCDWYVEASKAVLTRPVTTLNRENVTTEDAVTLQCFNDVTAQQANTLAVIDFVLSHTLRLFHPFLPFITEELWHGMGYATDMPEHQGGQTIMNAPWPKPFDADFCEAYGLDEAHLEFASQKYEVVTLGRNLRRIGNIQSGKKVKFVLKPSREIPAPDGEVIKLLLNAEALDFAEDYVAKKGTPTVHTAFGDLYLPLDGLIDVAAERARLTKEKEKIQLEITKVEQKLANPNFTQRAPAEVLRDHEQRLADWKEKLAHVKMALEALGT
ncbi:MAG: class I tRNA ligase family protein [Verrucomicrobiae bacterium]|nr:class I tRNA ligase family protein [Verrucomicrobiae bacterium]